jgi:predicted DNA-binding transcriptional regulator YafY
VAIDANEKIRFHYFQYDPRRERQLRHGGAWYEISPYALLWDSENYYLVGYDAAAGIIKHFRVDKIVDLHRTGQAREGAEVFADVDMSAYANAHFGMFSGKTTPVRMEFDNSLAGAVIDRFGTEAMLVPTGEGRFSVTANVAVTEPFFGWLCTFGGLARITAPESAVEAMRRHIESILEQYGEEKGKT